MDRRSFLRAALFGVGGAVTVAAVPEMIADMLLPKKSYFFLGRDEAILRIIEERLWKAHEEMMEMLTKDLYLNGGVGARIDGISASSELSLDDVGPWQGLSRKDITASLVWRP